MSQGRTRDRRRAEFEADRFDFELGRRGLAEGQRQEYGECRFHEVSESRFGMLVPVWNVPSH